MKKNSEYLVSSHSSQALSLYYCGWENCRSGHFFGPAIRSHYLFHFILSGQGSYTVKQNTYRLHAGQGFLICPGESTYYEADKDIPWSYCWFSFDGYEAKMVLESCGLSSHQLIFDDHSDGKLKEAVFAMIESFEESQTNEYAILSRLYSVFACMKLSSPASQEASNQSYIDKALTFISNNFSYDIKIQDIAKHIGIDRTYLYKIFMESQHCSPQQYLIRFRLDMASSLLENTAMNITEIAYSCGFKDAPAFYKHFKKHYSLTPVQYRESLSKLPFAEEINHSKIPVID